MHSPTGDKPKKIVINNVRKSVMIGKTSMTSSNLPPQAKGNGSEEEDATPKERLHTDKSNKQADQIAYYRQKHDQSLIKVRFLTDQLQTVGGLDRMPASIKNEISETQLKIKSLQQQLYFKRSKQMKKIKRKVKKFIEMLEFEVTQQDMDKIEDQVQIIFFIMDLFTEKYNQIMSEKSEIDSIVEKLKEDTVFNREELAEEHHFLHEKNAELTNYVRQLEMENFTLKKQGFSRNHYDGVIKSVNTRIYDESIRNLQSEIEHLHSKIRQQEAEIKDKEFALVNLKRRADESESNLSREKSKNRELQFDLERVQKQEVRWKERYSVMEEQKNERIRLLEAEKRKIEDSQLRRVKIGQAHPSRIKDTLFDPHFQWQEDIAEQSEEFYDLTDH